MFDEHPPKCGAYDECHKNIERHEPPGWINETENLLPEIDTQSRLAWEAIKSS